MSPSGVRTDDPCLDRRAKLHDWTPIDKCDTRHGVTVMWQFPARQTARRGMVKSWQSRGPSEQGWFQNVTHQSVRLMSISRRTTGAYTRIAPKGPEQSSLGQAKRRSRGASPQVDGPQNHPSPNRGATTVNASRVTNIVRILRDLH